MHNAKDGTNIIKKGVIEERKRSMCQGGKTEYAREILHKYSMVELKDYQNEYSFSIDVKGGEIADTTKKLWGCNWNCVGTKQRKKL